MFAHSAIGLSGQWWKLVASVLALLVGSFAPLYPATGISWTFGTVIAIAGYVFGVVSIRCVNCKRMWFWEAAKDASLYSPLFTRDECPGCHHKFG